MTALFLAVVGFLPLILIVVTAHELGHYYAARFFRLRVLRFSVGFGKPLFSKTDSRGTEWVVAPIPLGGYVQMLDKAEASEKGLPFMQSEESRPPWQRFILYAAGPAANFLLAAVIYAGLAMGGESQERLLVGKVRPDSPAARAGFLVGDEIAAVNGERVNSWRAAWARMVAGAVDGDGLTVRMNSGAERVMTTANMDPNELSGGVYRWLGFAADTSHNTSEVRRVLPGTAAERAGLRAGDVIVAVNDNVVDGFFEVSEIVLSSPGVPLTLALWRDGGEAQAVATPDNRNGYGFLGMQPVVDMQRLADNRITVEYSLAEAVGRGVSRMVESVALTFKFLGLALTGGLGRDAVGGPVMIADEAGRALAAGWRTFWTYVAFISVSLGAINLVPFPVLDGGRMLQCALEMVLRRPLPDRLRHGMDRVGMAALVGLMAYVILNDIARLLQ